MRHMNEFYGVMIYARVLLTVDIPCQLIHMECGVCCSVLQCVAVCCSVLCCVAAVYIPHPVSIDPHGMWSVLQCAAVCCSVLQCVAVYCADGMSDFRSRHSYTSAYHTVVSYI